MPHSPIRQLLILLLLFVLPASPMAEETQNVMSDLKDFVVESEWGKKQKKRFDDFKENVDSTFQPLVRLREQHACSAGWRGNECEQMFPETRERVGRSLESLRENAASAPRRARDLEARLAEEAGEARAGLKRLLETDAEKAERVRNVRDLALIEARKEQERIDALSARNIAEQQQMAREFSEGKAREERERQQAAREREAREAEQLAQHESEMNQAVGVFLNILGAAAAGQRTSAPVGNSYQQRQAQPDYSRSNAEFQARKQQIEQQQALQRQQQFQDEARARQGIGSGGSSGGTSPYCYKEEGINGRYVCR